MSSREVMEESVEYRARLIADALRRQTWIIVAAALLGALLGFGASLARPGSYVSTASVVVKPLAGNPYAPGVSGADSATAIQTESKVASSDSLAALVAEQLGDGADQGKLEKGVSASVVPGSSVIQIAFAAGDASFAREAAQAFADSFLAYRVDQAAAVNAAQVASLEDQKNTVQGQLDDATRQKQSGTLGLDPLIKNFTQQIGSLGVQINALKAQKPDAGRVISPAGTPKNRSGFGPVVYVGGGLMFGLVGGVALALARQRRDDRVLHVDEIENAGLPVLATWGGTPARSAEATRLIRSRALGVTARPAVIVVGASRLHGRETKVAAQLAESLANVGRSVVFADLAGDPTRAPGDPVPYGFTDFLTGRRSDMRDLLVELDPNLTVLPRGRASLGSAIEFLDADRMREVIEELPHHAEYVVVHVPTLTDSVGETMMEIAHLSVVTVMLARSTRTELALVKSRGDDRVGACVTPRTRRRLGTPTRRSRSERSAQMNRTDDGLKLLGDDDSDEEIPA
jgi:capsular polysaccharide biosynthesis protein